MMNQKTIKTPVTCHGVGVHSGDTMTLRMLPAEPGTGIVFERTDVEGHGLIPARWDHVVSTRFCTEIANEAGVKLGTIEHLIAALAASEVDNVHILVNGPEIPIMDGSSEAFMALIEEAGIVEQEAPRSFLRVLKPMIIEDEHRRMALYPADRFSIEFKVDFGHRQGLLPEAYTFDTSMEDFRAELSRARTYGFLEDAKKLYAAGLAKGASLENAVVFDKGKVLNTDGLRYSDECVRHKVLDAIGDLYLSGAPLRARVVCYNSGHEFNNKILKALFADTEAFAFEPEKSLSISGEEGLTSSVGAQDYPQAVILNTPARAAMV